MIGVFFTKLRTSCFLAVSVCLLIVSQVPVTAQTTSTRKATPTYKMSPLDQESLGRIGVANLGLQTGSIGLPSSGTNTYVPLHIEFDSVAARLQFRPPAGITIFHEFQQFADAFLDPQYSENVERLKAMNGVRWIDVGAQQLRIPVPPKMEIDKTGAKSLGLSKIVRGGYKGLTGKGTVVVIIDDGIDYYHPDFTIRDKDGKKTSRILYYWDTYEIHKESSTIGRPGPYKYPNGAPLGVVYDQRALTEKIRSGTRSLKIGEGRHGTPCAGITAGNGQASDGKFVGVAPEADIIAVKIGRSGPWSMYLLNAICSWLDDVVGDRPYVLSCSFGHAQLSGRDGCRVTERQLDARFPATKKGRAICIAAGNERNNGLNSPYHAKVKFSGSSKKGFIQWTANPSSRNRVRVSIYVRTKNPDDVVLERGDLPANNVHRYMHPLSQSLVFELSVKNLTGSSFGTTTGQVALYSKSRQTLTADAFIDSSPSWFVGRFTGSCAARTNYLRFPGTMKNCITVGSYDFNAMDTRVDPPVVYRGKSSPVKTIGQLSYYSSPGYNRLGIIKPTIVAPGQFHISPKSSYASRTTPTGLAQYYQLFNGTSAATPYTAGIVSLMFQKQPTLTFGEIKSLLIANAATDSFTGRTPNPEWGHGRLGYESVERILAAIPGKATE